jgi:glycosyltransferase involved in cell wall biosynthesis
LFEAGNNEDLKEKLEFALGNFGDLVGLSERSVRERFSWERSIEKLYNFIK